MKRLLLRYCRMCICIRKSTTVSTICNCGKPIAVRLGDGHNFVSVVDVKDNSVEFDVAAGCGKYFFTVDENQSAGTFVGQGLASAVDPNGRE